MGWVFKGGAGESTQRFYDQFGAEGRSPVSSDTITIASAYGARTKTEWEPSAAQRDQAIRFLADAANPQEERRNIELALGYLEAQFQMDIGIEDRASLDWMGSGDPTQMDCVDEAWNATALLEWLHYYHYEMHFHSIREPMWKTPLFRWTHYGAIIETGLTEKLWAIDGGVRRGGQPPKIYDAETWYE